MVLLIVGFATIAFAVSFLPKQASAFWPFSTRADAAGNTVIPSSSTPILSAPTNSNPNSSAPVALAISGDSALVPYSGPSGATASAAGIVFDRISVYVVRQGDTLSDTGAMFNVSVNTIVWANNLKSTNDVHPGDTLIILPISGIERTIAKGDTLKLLAKKYGADVNEIASYNNLDPDAPLAVGSTIIIPGGELAVPATPARSVRGRSLQEPYLGGGGVAFSGYFTSPVPGAPVTQGLHGWNAIDFGAARGTPIYAAADGVVIIARSGGWNGGYGNYVVITHGNGTQTLYAHMRSQVVSYGQTVSQGQLIGYVGSSGLSTGPHLHFEVRGAKNPFANCDLRSVCSPE